MLAPLLISGLMGVPGLVSGIMGAVESGKRLRGGGRLRGPRGGRRARPARRRVAGALTHMGDWPLISRPHEYHQGGALMKRLARANPKGRAPRRRRGGNALEGFRSFVHAIPIVGQISQALGFGGRAHPRPHYVRSHTKLSPLGKVVHVRGHTAAGYGGRMPPRPHMVRGHVAHSKLGTPYYVKSHMAAGLLRPAGGAYRPSLHPRNILGQFVPTTGRGLLAPAGGRSRRRGGFYPPIPRWAVPRF